MDFFTSGVAAHSSSYKFVQAFAPYSYRKASIGFNRAALNDG